MEFRILGPLEVADAGRPLPLGGGKQRALLATLLLHANEVVARDRLIDVLWGGRPPDTAATALQVHVSQLRKLLAAGGARTGESMLVTRAPGYVLRIDPDQLDLRRFERLLGEGKAALAGGDASAARASLGEALGLWRGPPLADLDALPFARQEAVRLEELRLSALEGRIEADLALGRHADLVPELDGLVAAHPLRERVRGQLMLALYRCGRQSDALDVYRKGRGLLSEELGLEPGQALQRLERAILNQEPQLDPPSPGRPGAHRLTQAPTGVVTFLFTDVEGSTRLAKLLRDRWGDALSAHQRLLREAFTRHGGYEVDTQGDAFFFAFSSAHDALAAAVDGQRALDASEWPEGARVRARIGLHTSQASVAEGRYLGVGVHRAARICAAAHGGQVLVSQATRELLEDEEGAESGVTLRDLGLYRLKDLDRPVRLYQVVAPGLEARFAPLRAERAPGRKRRRPLVIAAAALAVAGVVLAALALTRDSDTPVVVGPNSVAVIDPDSNAVVAAIPVGESPGPIAAGLGGVWVYNRNDLTVSRLDPAKRQVVEVIPAVTGAGRGLEALSASLLAVGEGALWTGHADSLRRTEPDRSGLLTIELPFSDFWTGIATGLGRVWLAGYGLQLVQIDPDRAVIGEVVSLADRDNVAGVSSIAVGLRSVWVALAIEDDGTGGEVIRYEPATGDTARTRIEGSPSAIAVGARAVWVTDATADVLLRVRPRPLAVLRSVPVGDNPAAVALGAGAVWTANAGDGTVSRVDPATNEVRTIVVGHRPQGVVVANGLVWVSVRSA